MAKSTSKLFQDEEPKEMNEQDMNAPEEEKKAEIINMPEQPSDGIQDINISAIKRKPFRINGDPNRLIELNTSDLGISSRMSAAYDRLVAYMDDVSKVLSNIPDDDTEFTEDTQKMVGQKLQEIDEKMREEIDYIFDAPVSKACDYGGSMYDPFEGMFRFEHIIDAITKLYETNINSEFNKMRRRINAKTSKYSKKYHK